MKRKVVVWVFTLLSLLSIVTTSFGAVILLNKVGQAPSHWMGLSTDARPVGIAYGSTFYAEDTGLAYMYGASGWVVDNRNLGDS